MTPTFKTPEDSDDWAEKKGILRRCYTHNRNFDPSIGCPECNAGTTKKQTLRPDQLPPIAHIKPGYKLHGGSYWEKLPPHSILEPKLQTLTDNEGVWIKTAPEKALYTTEEWNAIKDILIQIPEENPQTTQRLEILKTATNALAQVFQTHTTKENKTDETLVESSLNASNPKRNIQETTAKISEKKISNPPMSSKSKREHPSFWEDVRRMVLGQKGKSAVGHKREITKPSNSKDINKINTYLKSRGLHPINPESINKSK